MVLVTALRFEEMSVQSSDFGLYDRLARAEMHVEDLVSGEELLKWIAEGRVRAWMVYDGAGVLVGWCSVMTPSTCHPTSSSVHLLGNIVFGDRKRRGIGKAMADWRVAQFGNRPLTASVQPGNLASERVLASCGFRPGFPEQGGPWTVWHRPPTQERLALVRLSGDMEN